MDSVGSYEAKTHLPRLLKRVARGERVTITRNGKPVAMLVPPPQPTQCNVQEVIERILEHRNGRTLGEGLTIRDLIEEGRRF